jgi:hypothetical protein
MDDRRSSLRGGLVISRRRRSPFVRRGGPRAGRGAAVIKRDVRMNVSLPAKMPVIEGCYRGVLRLEDLRRLEERSRHMPDGVGRPPKPWSGPSCAQARCVSSRALSLLFRSCDLGRKSFITFMALSFPFQADHRPAKTTSRAHSATYLLTLSILPFENDCGSGDGIVGLNGRLLFFPLSPPNKS